MNSQNFLIHILDKYCTKHKKPLNQIPNKNCAITSSNDLKKSNKLNQTSNNQLEQMIKRYKSQITINTINAGNFYTQTILNRKDDKTHINNFVNQSCVLSLFKRNDFHHIKIVENNFNQNNLLTLDPKTNHFKSPILTSSHSKNVLIQTSDETTNMLKSIDEKIKELKLQLLHDTFFNLTKLSYYDKSLTTTLAFLQNNEIKDFFYSSHQIKTIVLNLLDKNCIKYIIDPFNILYDKYLLITHKKMSIRNHKKDFTINIIIRCKVVLSKQYKSNTIEFSNRFSLTKDLNKKEYKNVYKFDYYYDENDTHFWMMKEDTYFNYDELSKAYAMPIIPFNLNDFFHITVNLFSGIGLIHFQSFKWENISFKYNKNYKDKNFNNSSKISHGYQLSDFDLSRFCELELIKTKWLNYTKKTNLPELIHNEIAGYTIPLQKLLVIQKIEYDDVGYIIIKIHAIAIKAGMLDLTNLGIKLTIKKSTDQIMNEIRKNGLLFEMSNKIEIREGNLLFLYLSLNKYLEEIQTIIY